MPNCPYCSKPIPKEVYRNTECSSCGHSLHCCECCIFYSPSSHYGCKEDIDEPIWDKEKANFCSYFRLNDAVQLKNNKDEKSKAKEALDKLFSI